tara:strand:+ start:1479 stop:1790 length:312 start_codon:yes stop_codon:yes gene_type:complete
MITSTKILVREKVAEDLALRDSAREFFDVIESLSTSEVVLDFKDIRSISRSFAHEYNTLKKMSDKKIKEINVPQDVKKMFAVVQEHRVKKPVFNLKAARVVSL